MPIEEHRFVDTPERGLLVAKGNIQVTNGGSEDIRTFRFPEGADHINLRGVEQNGNDFDFRVRWLLAELASADPLADRGRIDQNFIGSSPSIDTRIDLRAGLMQLAINSPAGDVDVEWYLEANYEGT